MDVKSFDQMVKALATPGARRRVLHLLASVPLVAGFAALAPEEESAAASRRKRRNNPHPRRHRLASEKKRKKKKHKKKCKPAPLATTCAGRCGPVMNNCQKTVACGICPCGTCLGDGACSEPCDGAGCCNGTTCQPGTADSACGKNGEACQSCTGTGVTCGGGGTEGVCGCIPNDPCGAGSCGNVQNTCGESVNCGTCSNPTPVCVSNTCTACSGGNPCPSGQVCDAGSCQACDVCASGCPFSSVQAAIDAASSGDTIHICPGTYGRVNVNKYLTLIGAGDGPNAASNTILNGSGSGTTLQFNGVIAAAQGLRIIGGSGTSGGGIFNAATTTLTNCTVVGNNASSSGGGIYNAGGSMKLFSCIVAQNNAASNGGGIYSGGFFTLNDSDVTGNTAGSSGGGIYNSTGSVTLENGSTVTFNIPNNCFGTISGSGCG